LFSEILKKTFIFTYYFFAKKYYETLKMSWKNIISHERSKKILQKSILEKKVAGAYLFWGIEGIGKSAVAIEFAKTLNCQNPIINENSISACDNCRSCKQFASLAHPNLHLVFSLPPAKNADSSDSSVSKLSDEQIELIREQILAKSQNIYHKISIPNAAQIKINAIRELKRNLTMTSNISGWRVAIIFNAEEMTTEASNAFLKTLEEPHERTTIILISSKKEMLLQTIVSRCQQLYFEPIPDVIIENYLIDEYNISQAEAKIIANFAQGSINTAKEFLDSNISEYRDNIVEILRIALKNTYRIELSEKIEELINTKNKQFLENSLRLLQNWFRDCFVLLTTRSRERIINLDLLDRITKFAELFPNADYLKIINEIEHSIYLIRRNVNLQLIVFSLFMKIRLNLLAK